MTKKKDTVPYGKIILKNIKHLRYFASSSVVALVSLGASIVDYFSISVSFDDLQDESSFTVTAMTVALVAALDLSMAFVGSGLKKLLSSPKEEHKISTKIACIVFSASFIAAFVAATAVKYNTRFVSFNAPDIEDVAKEFVPLINPVLIINAVAFVSCALPAITSMITFGVAFLFTDPEKVEEGWRSIEKTAYETIAQQKEAKANKISEKLATYSKSAFDEAVKVANERLEYALLDITSLEAEAKRSVADVFLTVAPTDVKTTLAEKRASIHTRSVEELINGYKNRTSAGIFKGGFDDPGFDDSGFDEEPAQTSAESAQAAESVQVPAEPAQIPTATAEADNEVSDGVFAPEDAAVTGKPWMHSA